jgi:hypothetical protein
VDRIAGEDEPVRGATGMEVDEAIAVARAGLPVARQVGDDYRDPDIERPEPWIGGGIVLDRPTTCR